MRDAEWIATLGTLGQHIRETRQLIGWSQTDLADRAHTSQGTISRMERGHVKDLYFLSVCKVLVTLADDVPAVNGVVSPTIAGLLAAIRQIMGTTLPAPEPALAHLILTYHALSPTRRRFLQHMLQLLGEPRL